ncbi:MAG: hypothetical protein M3299_14725 [Thermoproteota archaeon]|nr:hypothetical protein [Thermoproteota archaeon]
MEPIKPHKSALGEAFENSKTVTDDDLVNRAIMNMLSKSSDVGDDQIIRRWGRKKNNNVKW